MKDYNKLLAGLFLLLLVIFIGVFAWLWTSNLKDTNPLPIMANGHTELSIDTEKNSDTIASSVLYLQAEDKIQVPLDDVIVNFESRYPRIQVLARYVPKKSLLNLPNASISENQPSPFIVNTDIIIADDELLQSQLVPIQMIINKAQGAYNQSKINANKMMQDSESENVEAMTPKDNNETRNIVSFSYALKGDKAIDGVILTSNPIAVTFRNFLLSSTGQDILKKYNYENIDGYKSSVDDLFNPTSGGKSANGKNSVKIAEALETK